MEKENKNGLPPSPEDGTVILPDDGKAAAGDEIAQCDRKALEGGTRVSKMRQHLPDIILILALLIIGAVLLVFSRSFGRGSAVTVSIDGEVAGEYSLMTDGRYPLNGGTNTLVIEGGSARIEDADCPDKLCERQGRISRVGERIVCLPNRVSVEVVG